jgi:NAD(P)-dependent dehydrogenase (short-subunit alcohol dehydrogenase family)
MLKGKVAIVTGAESGIGRQIAIKLSENGCKVLVVYLDNWAEARKTQRLCKGKTGLCAADLSDMNDCRKVVDSAIEYFGKIDILVNNAGTIVRKKFLLTTERDYDNVMNVNLKAIFFLSQYAAKKMKKGSIINISSFRASRSRPWLSVYDISKAGVEALTRNLSLELAPKIRVNAVSPGAISTKMLSSQDSKSRKALLSQIPMKRFGKPEEVAEAVLFLADDEKSSYITGATIEVDGGILD